MRKKTERHQSQRKAICLFVLYTVYPESYCTSHRIARRAPARRLFFSEPPPPSGRRRIGYIPSYSTTVQYSIASLLARESQ